MALVVAPEPPFEDWLTALDQQMQRSAGFFADRPIVANLAAVNSAGIAPDAMLDALDERDLRIIGVEGIDLDLLAGTRWARLPKFNQGRDAARDFIRDVTPPSDPQPRRAAPEPPAPEPRAPEPRAPEPQANAAEATQAAGGPPSLLIDRPVRSGQSVVFEEGDVIVVGPVASGAEIIAGGSIHVYGALRGRAIAGIRTGSVARIFCRRLAAELLAIDGLYRTAEHWGEGLHDRPVQAWLDEGALRLSAFD